MEIVRDVLSFLAEIALTALAVLVALALVAVLLGIVCGAVEAVHLAVAARRKSAGPPPSYSLTLLIRFDQQSGLLHPSAQLRGEGVLTKAWIRLELIDGDGTLRLVRRSQLPRTAIGTEFPLPVFEPPNGAGADEVLGWHWDVLIEDKEGERARWREHPRPAGYLNAEAELA